MEGSPNGFHGDFYAAPSAEVEDRGVASEFGVPELATRGSRLAATMLDGIIGWAGLLPLFVVAESEVTGETLVLVLFGFGILCVAGVLLVNMTWLHATGQTIGKRMLGIRLVNTDMTQSVSLGRIIGLRFLPVTLLGAIPIVGGFISLLDALMIFGEDRRCLHDRIAGTAVVKAETFHEASGEAW